MTHAHDSIRLRILALLKTGPDSMTASAIGNRLCIGFRAATGALSSMRASGEVVASYSKRHNQSMSYALPDKAITCTDVADPSNRLSERHTGTVRKVPLSNGNVRVEFGTHWPTSHDCQHRDSAVSGPSTLASLDQ